MTLLLSDLFSLDALDVALEQGLVRVQLHPTYPLAILNYTQRAAYDGVWNDVTRQCRGLIYDGPTTRVVARPFRKFFNYGQNGAPEFDLDARAVVTEKMDGSLGILYPAGEGYAIATRGSFTSDQAIYATSVYLDKYAETFVPSEGFTYLFEIVYPENRIVCDYGEQDDLVLLAALNTETGRPNDFAEATWPGPTVETHPHLTLSAALEAEPRPGAEGVVVYFPDTNERVKLKQDDYVELHRIVTRLNKRTVWEHLYKGRPLADLIEPLPDEFRPWVEDVIAELSALVADQAREIERVYSEIVNELTDDDYGSWVCEECGGGLVLVTEGCEGGACPAWACSTFGCSSQWRVVEPSRRDFAELATKSLWSWALFLRLDGKDYRQKLLYLSRPEPETPGRAYSEDVA